MASQIGTIVRCNESIQTISATATCERANLGSAPEHLPSLNISNLGSNSKLSVKTIHNAEDDENLLHPKPRKSQLSRRDRKIFSRIDRLKGPKWEPGKIIRLLPDAVHIKTCSEEGLDIDHDLPSPPTVPKRPTLPFNSAMMFAGVQIGGIDQKPLYENASGRAWTDKSPVFIHVSLSNPQGFGVVNSSGKTIENNPVTWVFGFELIEKREAAAEIFRTQINAEVLAIDQQFNDAARKYRIERRQWEIMVVKHEFFKRKNFKIFRPGLTREAVRRTIRMGENDSQKDAEYDKIKELCAFVGESGFQDWVEK